MHPNAYLASIPFWSWLELFIDFLLHLPDMLSTNQLIFVCFTITLYIMNKNTTINFSRIDEGNLPINHAAREGSDDGGVNDAVHSMLILVDQFVDRIDEHRKRTARCLDDIMKQLNNTVDKLQETNRLAESTIDQRLSTLEGMLGSLQDVPSKLDHLDFMVKDSTTWTGHTIVENLKRLFTSIEEKLNPLEDLPSKLSDINARMNKLNAATHLSVTSSAAQTIEADPRKPDHQVLSLVMGQSQSTAPRMARPLCLAMSSVAGCETAPIAPTGPKLGLSAIKTLSTAPVWSLTHGMSFSSTITQATEPRAAPIPALSLSPITAQTQATASELPSRPKILAEDAVKKDAAVEVTSSIATGLNTNAASFKPVSPPPESRAISSSQAKGDQTTTASSPKQLTEAERKSKELHDALVSGLEEAAKQETTTDVFCKVCNKLVPVEFMDWANPKNPSKPKRSLYWESHERDHHAECPDCHQVASGIHDATADAFDFSEHQKVCRKKSTPVNAPKATLRVAHPASSSPATPTKPLFHCVNCGTPVTNKGEFFATHQKQCAAAAAAKGTLKAYDTKTGAFIGKAAAKPASKPAAPAPNVVKEAGSAPKRGAPLLCSAAAKSDRQAESALQSAPSPSPASHTPASSASTKRPAMPSFGGRKPARDKPEDDAEGPSHFPDYRQPEEAMQQARASSL